MGILVVGDIHHQEKLPKKEQSKKVLEFIFNNNHNTSDNVLFLLGDLVENVDSPYELLEDYVDYFLNKSRFRHIYILQGNHDATIISSLLSVFRPFKNITVIQDATILDIEGNKIMALPYYYEEGTNKPSMVKNYSEVLKGNPDFYLQHVDFVFHHVEDETEHFSKKFCDLSWIDTTYWLCGHIHTCSIQSGGRYLGACVLNSSSEKGRQPYIAYVENKKYSLIKVEKYLDYYNVVYPDNLPEIDTPLALWTVNDSLDKEETILYYSKKAIDKGFTFYPRRIIKKDFAKFESGEITTDNEVSFIDQFNSYSSKLKINDEVKSICTRILQKRD